MTTPRRSGPDLAFLKDRSAIRRIAVATVALGVAGAVAGLALPRWYRSVLTVVPARGQKASGLAAMLGGDLGALASTFEGSMGGGADTARIAAVLQSTAVTDALIEKFDLRGRYGKRVQENAREEVWKLCSVKILPKPNLVQVSCEDRDPAFAQKMVEYLATYGNEVFRRVNVGSAAEEARQMEKRVAELRQQADDAAQQMREFQEKYQIVDLDTQAKALVSSVATLHAQRLSKQMQLEYARTFSSPEETGRRQLESQLGVVDEVLRDMESPRIPSNPEPARKGARHGMFPATLDVPRLRAEYERLLRDRKVSEATLLFALDRLEGAKAAEARDVSTFVVLDPATLPTRKSRPSGLLYALGGAMLGAILGTGWSWWAWRRAARG